jgi:hypothetical protein
MGSSTPIGGTKKAFVTAKHSQRQRPHTSLRRRTVRAVREKLKVARCNRRDSGLTIPHLVWHSSRLGCTNSRRPVRNSTAWSTHRPRRPRHQRANRIHAADQLPRSGPPQPMRTRTPVLQPGHALLAIPPDPLGRRLPAEPVLSCRLAQAQPAFHNSTAKNLSTMNRQTGMIVIVHSIS